MGDGISCISWEQRDALSGKGAFSAGVGKHQVRIGLLCFFFKIPGSSSLYKYSELVSPAQVFKTHVYFHLHHLSLFYSHPSAFIFSFESIFIFTIFSSSSSLFSCYHHVHIPLFPLPWRLYGSSRAVKQSARHRACTSFALRSCTYWVSCRI